MSRLLTRRNLKAVLKEDGITIDEEDTYQVYAFLWGKFSCEQCRREEGYKMVGQELAKETWIALAAEGAKADGWFVGPWLDGVPWQPEGGLDCTAFCAGCLQTRRQ
jgi:hypothetical protein